MKDEDKTKVEPIKDLKTLQKKREKSAVNNITKRKQAEEELKDSEEYLKILFDYAPDAYYVNDLKGNFIDGNKAAEKLTGYKREELIGKSFLKLKLLSLTDIPKAAKLLVRNLRGQPTGPDEFVMNRKDNTRVTVEISTYPVKIKGRTLVLGIARDVTERKKAEEEIRLHAAMMDNVAEGVYLIGLDDLLIKWTNEKFARMFGYDPGEIVGKQVDIVNAPTKRTPTETRISIVDVLRETGEWQGEVRNIKRDGTHFWCYANVSLFDHPEYGKVIMSVHSDITERKKAIKEIEELAKFPTENPNPVLRISKDGIVLFRNHASEPLLENWKYKEGKPLQDRWFQFILGVLEDGDIKTVEIKIGDKVISLTFAPIVEKDFVNIYGLDISERKQAEKALEKSEEKYRTVFENTGTAIAIIEEDMTISMANTQTERLSGYSKREIENKIRWTDFVVPEDLEKMKRYHMTRRQNGEAPPTEYEFRLKDKKGNIKNIFLKIGIIPGTKKSVASLIDITELKQGEARIKHLNLVLRAIRNINQLIFQEKSRERLIKGACNSLTAIRGYYSSFIVLLDEKGKIDTYAEAGLGKDFLPMLKRLKKGELTCFGKIALKQKKVIIIEDPASTCPDCPLVKVCSKRGSVMTIRLEHGGKIYGVMSVSIPVHFINDKEEYALFKEVAGDITLGLHSIELGEKLNKQTHDLKEKVRELKRAMDATIETMSKIVEAKDPYTAGHQQRVSQLATAIAKELNFSQDKIEGIRIASLIHDIGKIGLPTEILSKPIKLSDIEFSLIKEHPQIGYNILKSIDFSYPVANIILQHHERLNGSGYPKNLKGDKIFLEACIIGVADVVEAMSSHRPYRPALGIDKALEEISQNKGILYDPKVVDICLNLFKEKGFKFE